MIASFEASRFSAEEAGRRAGGWQLEGPTGFDLGRRE
jgi:hypothetical protein